MPRTSRILATQDDRSKAVKALISTGEFHKSLTDVQFRVDINGFIAIDNPDPIVFRIGTAERFRHAGIEPHDVVVINPLIKETPEKDSVIVSVITNDRDFDDYYDFEPEDDFAAADILDVEFIYPDETTPKRGRKRKGDVPGLKRIVVGVVTHIIREPRHIRESALKEVVDAK